MTKKTTQEQNMWGVGELTGNRDKGCSDSGVLPSEPLWVPTSCLGISPPPVAVVAGITRGATLGGDPPSPPLWSLMCCQWPALQAHRCSQGCRALMGWYHQQQPLHSCTQAWGSNSQASAGKADALSWALSLGPLLTPVLTPVAWSGYSHATALLPAKSHT